MHDNEVDHGLEFKGPRARDAFLRVLQLNPEIRIVDKPDMGPYQRMFKPAKRYVFHPEFDKPHSKKDIDYTPAWGSGTTAGGYPILTASEDESIGGDKGEDFKKDVEDAKERQKRGEGPKGKTPRAKQIDQDKKDLKARDYQ